MASKTELTPEELEKVYAEVEAMVAKIKDVIATHKSPDMDTQHILERVGEISLYSSISRTSAFGSMIYAATNGFVTGLTESQLVDTFKEVFKIVSETPGAQKSAETYAKVNAAYHEKKLSGEFEKVEGFVLPGDGKVH